MKKTMLEKTIDSIAKQNQRVCQHQIRHHEAIKKQIMQQKEQFYRLTQGESGIRHSRLGVKCGYFLRRRLVRRSNIIFSSFFDKINLI